MRKTLTIAVLAALTSSGAALAQEQTRTKTFDGPNVSATQTTTVDRETGTIDRDRTVTNNNTGNTASSTLDRQRTDTGAVVSRSQTGPAGNTRSLEGERVRTDNGSTFTGTATGRRGGTYGLAGSRSRDGQGNSSASQRVTNSAGETVFSRDRTTTRSNGQVNRSVDRSRKAGATRPPRARRPR
ncbi:hypothetical protein [Erythrobacter rubeus]|uniref:Uncharacterized protein n=1 Tax=Erythrobacter rubeus TaxID=2760803 RepID=A0ABR8KSZ5_9SPHN|nr:hypothetical protein [Erythrobacter rubeus]MBD2842208.1 hypothetical protein [Erythrobacter rubeus]